MLHVTDHAPMKLEKYYLCTVEEGVANASI